MNKISTVGILVWLVVIACAGAQRPQTMIMGESESEQIAEKGRVVVYFCVTGNRACKRTRPLIDQLALDFPSVKFLMFPYDEESRFVKQYHITTLPTTIFFVKGKEVNRLSGEQSVRKYIKILGEM